MRSACSFGLHVIIGRDFAASNRCFLDVMRSCWRQREAASTPARSAQKTSAVAIVGDRELPDDDAGVIRTLREFSVCSAGVVVEDLGGGCAGDA